MGEIMNSPKGVKSGVPERVRIPTKIRNVIKHCSEAIV